MLQKNGTRSVSGWVGTKYLAIRDEIVAHYAAGTLLQLFVEHISEHRHAEEGKAFRAGLIELHNAGVIDVLEPACTIATSSVSQFDFFDVQSVYVDIIPELEASAEKMLAAVKALVARGGDDLASSRPNGAFRAWAESGDRARAMIAQIDPANPEDAAYVLQALLALAKTEPEVALSKAITFLAEENLPARAGAAKAIGALPLTTAEARSRALDALEGARKTGADDNLLGLIMAAAVDIVRSVPTEEDKAIRLVDSIAADAGDQAIHHVISILLFHAGDLPAAITNALTRIAHNSRRE